MTVVQEAYGEGGGGGAAARPAVPVHAGLHHHGDEPHKPGYTLPELVHLSRSAVAAQRTQACRDIPRYYLPSPPARSSRACPSSCPSISTSCSRRSRRSPPS